MFVWYADNVIHAYNVDAHAQTNIVNSYVETNIVDTYLEANIVETYLEANIVETYLETNFIKANNFQADIETHNIETRLVITHDVKAYIVDAHYVEPHYVKPHHCNPNHRPIFEADDVIANCYKPDSCTPRRQSNIHRANFRFARHQYSQQMWNVRD
jgi:hypothetical protein